MPRTISEDQTRKQLIDPQLERAGWTLRDHSKVKEEIPVFARPEGFAASVQPSGSETFGTFESGVTDYCLHRENGEVLAVVEAKKTAVDVRLAEAQLTHYVTEIEKHQSFRPSDTSPKSDSIYKLVTQSLHVGFGGGRRGSGAHGGVPFGYASRSARQGLAANLSNPRKNLKTWRNFLQQVTFVTARRLELRGIEY